MSADDGATWRKIFSKQAIVRAQSFSADGSKIVLGPYGSPHFYISTDGGQSWTERGASSGAVSIDISPDGSFLTRCDVSGGATVFTIHISTDDGQTWTQKGTNSIGCPEYHTFNNGTMIATPYSVNSSNKHTIARSTDYGQTWTEISNFSDNLDFISFSNNGDNIFDGNRISLDGGNHWTPSNITTLAGGDSVFQVGISDDGKKLFAVSQPNNGDQVYTLHTSVDGGRTWRIESSDNELGWILMSSNGSKLFDANNTTFRAGTLTTSQPVTPGSGAGGAVAPSTGSTSAALNQKPGKASGRLAETGASVQLIGGLAVVAVAAGALVLRKRL